MRVSIRDRRARKRLTKSFDLQLTSMLDILVIILVFLLKSYQTSTNNFTTVPGMEIPMSKSMDVPPDSLHLIITPEGITFENNRIVEFEQTGDTLADEATYAFKRDDLKEGGRLIVPLADALSAAREKSELLRAKSTARDAQGNPLPFDGVLAIQADKRVSYDTIRRIMYTAGASGYKVFRLLALRADAG